MKRKTYWKALWQTLKASQIRFLSMTGLMAFGAFALVGLQTTPLSMEKTAQAYIEQTQMMDLAVIADYGLSQADQEELLALDDAEVSFNHMIDVSVKGTADALRFLSRSETVSVDDLIKGRWPSQTNELALDVQLSSRYQIGDQMTVYTNQNKTLPLKEDTFTVTGFVRSADMWVKDNYGGSSEGDGRLSGFAVLTPQAFDSSVYPLAKIRFHTLSKFPYYSPDYKAQLAHYQEELNKRLADNAKARFENITAPAQAEIDKGKAALRQAEEQFSLARQAIIEQQNALLAGNHQSVLSEQDEVRRADLSAEEQQVLAELARRRDELRQAEQALAQLPQPTYQVFTRASFPGAYGYEVYQTSTANLRTVSAIFPTVLYLVAALVTLTTMTRFVDDERQKMGIFRALGYSHREVMTGFLLYASLASGLGTLFGSLVGYFGLSQMVGNLLTTNSVLGEMDLFPQPIYVLVALGLAMMSTVLPTLVVTKRALSGQVASLLQANPPVQGASIWLEKIPYLWRGLRFTQKVMARNLFRYKQRLVMTVFGVAGSVLLLFLGLGIRSSISGVSPRQYETLIAYDLFLVEKAHATAEDKTSLERFLSANEDLSIHPLQWEQIEVEQAGDIETVSVMITPNDFSDFVRLYDSVSQQALTLEDDGIVISEPLARLMGVRVGDRLTVRLQGQRQDLRIAGIAEHYVGHVIYMSKVYYDHLSQQPYASNAYLITAKDQSSKSLSQLSQKLLTFPSVQLIIQNSQLTKQLDSLADALQSVMVVLVLVATLLAMTILYHLTNINLAERVRELSTIKVLGFYPHEVTLYCYRETICLSVVGIILGLISGHYLHHFIIGLIGSRQVKFMLAVDWSVYVIPVVIMIGIVTWLGVWVHRKLKALDMLEALKSVD